jgi:hypothetical protein
VILASEAGVLPVPDNKIVRKWRLQPGKMLLIDLEQGRMIDDEELKANVVNTKPYKQWIENLRIKLDGSKSRPTSSRPPSRAALLDRQQAFGFTQEDIKFLLTPWPKTAKKASAPWATTARWPCCPTRTSRCTTTSASCSRR